MLSTASAQKRAICGCPPSYTCTRCTAHPNPNFDILNWKLFLLSLID